MRLRRTNDVEAIKKLHSRIFPDDEWEDSTAYWILADDNGPAGFCSAYRLKHENGIFLTRAGVLQRARGSGIQRRMANVRLRWARSIGCRFAVTYCTYDNYSSIVNLLRSGFKFYDPHTLWAGNSKHYFLTEL